MTPSPLAVVLSAFLAFAAAIPTGAVCAQGNVASQSGAGPAPTAEASPGVVNINTATAEELSRLPGVGETRAQAIIAARQRHPFRRKQEIMRVRGIGRATFRRLEPMLALEGPTTLGR